jgi:hypothetical protein
LYYLILMKNKQEYSKGNKAFISIELRGKKKKKNERRPLDAKDKLAHNKS